jgi:hypothetical protein
MLCLRTETLSLTLCLQLKKVPTAGAKSKYIVSCSTRPLSGDTVDIAAAQRKLYASCHLTPAGGDCKRALPVRAASEQATRNLSDHNHAALQRTSYNNIPASWHRSLRFNLHPRPSGRCHAGWFASFPVPHHRGSNGHPCQRYELCYYHLLDVPQDRSCASVSIWLRMAK